MNNPSLIIGTTLGFTLGAIVLGYGFYSKPKDPCQAVAEAYALAQERSRHLSGDAGGISMSEDLGIEMAGVVSQALGVSCLIAPEVKS